MFKWFTFQVILNIFILLYLHQNVLAQTFLLNGNIVGKDTGRIVLSYRNAENQAFTDTAIIKQGKFQFKGSVIGTDYAFLDSDPGFIYGDGSNKFFTLLFIEPGMLKISFKFGDISNARITGSKIQAESDAFDRTQLKQRSEIKHIITSTDSIRTLLKSGSIESHIADIKIEELNKLHDPIWQKMINNSLSYIKAHPQSHVSLKLLKYAISHIPNDSVDIYYEQISGNVKNTSLDYSFQEYFSRYKKAIGDEYPFDKIREDEVAPAFTVYSSAADSITLDSFKGNVVLLEFWGLDCLPCLQANPVIEQLRAKYNKEYFKVIAISNTQLYDLPKLISYIGKNKLSKWTHVSTNSYYKQMRQPLLIGEFRNYFNIGVPRTILLDKNGRVIYKKIGYSPDDIQNLESLLDKAINAPFVEDTTR